MADMTGLTFEELTEAAKAAEWYETDSWAAKRILDVELLTRDVLDPCAGRGVLGDAARARGYNVVETDLNRWPGQSPKSEIIDGINFLEDELELRTLMHNEAFEENNFTVLMNPPFSLATKFIDQSLRLGARKIVMFQRLNFLESGVRRDFYESRPPARIWLCGDRATCWRGDLPKYDIRDEGGNVIVKGTHGRSAPTAHAWFVWEREHKGIEVLHRLWRKQSGNE